MKVVVFGAGYWGVNYIRELGRHCVGVVEPGLVRATYTRERFAVPVFPDLPDDLPFDGAVIATPPAFHVPLVQQLLRVGRYVLVEKPLCEDVSTAEELLGAPGAEQHCMASHVYLWHPGVLKLQQYSNELQHVFSRRTNAGPVRLWGNALWDLASHDVSIALYLAGFHAPCVAQAFSASDHALLRLQFSRWDMLSYVSWHGGPKVRQVELVLRDAQERVVFDDVKTVLEVPPLARMLQTFLSGKWDARGALQTAVQIVKILHEASNYGSSVHQNPAAA